MLHSLDFGQAKAKHLLFKTNLRSILYGADLNPGPVLSHFECGVGKWIYGYALERYGHIAEMQQLEKTHAEIHQCASTLLALYSDGKVKQARDGLADMELIADRLISLLEITESKISGEVQSTLSRGDATIIDANYQELLNLHATIRDLDSRIKEQTLLSNAARIKAEENENKFRNTVMQAPVGIVILRGNEMIVEMANETYALIVDKKTEVLVGHSIYTILPEIKEIMAPILLGVMQRGQPFYGNEFELTLNRFGKSQQSFFNFVYSPLREDDGRITGVMVVATEVTSQVQAKLALELKDTQFRNLVSQSPVAMAIVRGEDLIVEIANDTMLRTLWRKTLQEVEGRKLLDIFPELTEQQFPLLLMEVLRTGVVHKQFEAQVIINSGDGSREYYLDFEYSRLSEMDSSVGAIMVTANDVTEKVIARRKIELAEKQYRDLIDVLPVAVFTVDINGYLHLYNQAAVNLWQRVPEKGVDKWCGSHGLFTLDKVFVPHEDCPMATALKEERAITTEAYVERPGGELRHVIAHPQPLYNEVGEVVGAMNVLIDITDRKEAEIALVASEEKFRVLANSMPQLIWTADATGELNYFSQSVFDYSGLSKAKFLQNGWIGIVHPDDREANLKLWLNSVNSGVDFHFEHRFRRHDGEYRWQLSRAVSQKDNEGNILMWVGTSTDIHDRHVFLDELKIKVEERTKELTNSNESLVKSNAELAQFAYVASHDLQEPLRKIQIFVSRILEFDRDLLSQKSQGYFERVHRSANKAQQLILDLLSFSRVNTIDKNFEPTDLNKLIAKLKDDFAEANNTPVTIKAGVLPTLPVISFQFEQLFENLLTNAIKFSNKDIPCVIQIEAGVVEGTIVEKISTPVCKRYHAISVRDNGVGFDPQFSERIFLVFQRLHSQESYEGTGIGLSICKKIIENHNGFIDAIGVPGEGATFNIFIPAHDHPILIKQAELTH